jgi:hypothetical protein
MTHVPHPDARGNAPHIPTPPDSGQQPRVEFAHPFLRALAEAEHPEFEPVSHADTDRVFRYTPDHMYVGAFFADARGALDPLTLTAWFCGEIVRPASWWDSVGLSVALEDLELRGIQPAAASLLKSVIAIMADDERRDA